MMQNNILNNLKEIWGWRPENRQSSLVTIVTLLSSYIILFILAYGFVARSAVSLSVILILLSAKYFGFIGGIVAGGLSLPINSLLFILCGEPAFSAFAGRNFIFSHLVFIFLGIGFGALYHLHHKLTKTLQTMSKQQEQLSIINRILRHDLTNHLTSIRSGMNLLGDNFKPETQKEIKEKVTASIDLIEKMRDIEATLAENTELCIIDIQDCFQRTISRYPSIHVNISGDGSVLADEALDSVLDNIFSNSIIHGKADSINIDMKPYRHYLSIQIADNGQGIPQELQNRVFEEGFTFGNTGNTGLGLYIVQKTMERYHGFVTLESNAPRGVVITLFMKLAKN